MPQTNCKGCERRHVGCHAHCEIYQAYRKKQDELLKAKNLYKEALALEVSRTLEKATIQAMKRKAGSK
jgi:hypothetical protein